VMDRKAPQGMISRRKGKPGKSLSPSEALQQVLHFAAFQSFPYVLSLFLHACEDYHVCM